MPRRTLDDDDSHWDDDSDDPDWGSDEDADDLSDDGEPTVECPYCGREVHEDSPRCPHCERYLSDEDAPLPRKPWWIIAGTVVCLYLVYRWTFG